MIPEAVIWSLEDMSAGLEIGLESRKDVVWDLCDEGGSLNDVFWHLEDVFWDPEDGFLDLEDGFLGRGDVVWSLEDVFLGPEGVFWNL